MKALITSGMVCVACTLACSAIVSAVSFAVFVVTACVYGWRQSKENGK